MRKLLVASWLIGAGIFSFLGMSISVGLWIPDPEVFSPPRPGQHLFGEATLQLAWDRVEWKAWADAKYVTDVRLSDDLFFFVAATVSRPSTIVLNRQVLLEDDSEFVEGVLRHEIEHVRQYRENEVLFDSMGIDQESRLKAERLAQRIEQEYLWEYQQKYLLEHLERYLP